MNRYENLPPKLRETGKFNCWRYIENPDKEKPDKIPFNPKTGGNGQSNNPSTFTDYQTALSAVSKYDGLGIGVFGELAVLDIDGCAINGRIVSEMAKDIIAIMDCYTEISPSGTGLRLICKAADFVFDKVRYYIHYKKLGLEIYVAGATKKYLTVTGNAIRTGDLEERGDRLLQVLEKYMRRPGKSGAASGAVPTAESASIADIPALARKAKNKDKFIRLFDNGDISGYESRSNADIALCNILAFYAGDNEDTIDALFRQSKLYREKWERPDYRRDTIRKAIDSCNGKYYHAHSPFFIFYDPERKCERISCPLLAKAIRENERYIFVKDSARGGVNRFVYDKGVYRQYNDDMLKGMIKQYITDYDETLLKMSDVNEVFNQLITDRVFHEYENINADESIINFENCILDVMTLETRPHSPDILSTIQIPCVWTGKPEPTPQFDKFVVEFTGNDAPIINLLLECQGASLSNLKCWRMKKALFVVGPGDTGKSVLKSLNERLLGRGLFVSIDLKELEARFGTANLYNKRMAGASDMSFLAILELKVFKKATGGDSLFAEYKGMDGFEFVYNGFLWFCMNRLPKFGGDDGEWVYDRIMQVDCKNVMPLGKQDKLLLDKLYAERNGIIYKAVMALRNVIGNGYVFSEPESVKLARKIYRSENNTPLAFWAECITERPDGKIIDGCTTSKVYEVYKAWCNDNNHGYAKTSKEFREEICSLLKAPWEGVTVRRACGNVYRLYTLTNDAKRTYSKAYGWEDIPPCTSDSM